MIAFVAGGEKGGKEAAELERKLGSVEKDGGVAAGKIGKWFVDRYGMDPGAFIFSPFAHSRRAR